MNARVLAYVEGLQMQAVSPSLKQQRVDQHRCEAATLVANEAVAQHAEIADEVGRAGIGRERGMRWDRIGMCGGPPRRIMIQPTSRRADS